MPAILTRRIKDGMITLCGSTRFEATFAEVNQRLTLAGHVVLSLGTFHLPDPGRLRLDGDSADLSRRVGDVHLHEVRMADEVHAVDPGDYEGVVDPGE